MHILSVSRLAALTLVVILSQSILGDICSVAAATDDEFAEFDDLTLADQDSQQPSSIHSHHHQQQQQQLPKQQQQQQQRSADKDQQSSGDSVSTSNHQNKDHANNNNKQSSSKDHFVDDHLDEPQDQPDAKSSSQETKRPDLKLVNAPAPKLYRWESYYIEIAFLAASFLYFLNFVVGSSKNRAMAGQWYDQSRNLLKQQFTLVGGSPIISDGNQKRDEDQEPAAGAKRQRGLIKSTESMYTLWNSGRVGLDGLLVEINLLKRQDLFSMALTLLKSTKDTMVFRFLLNQEGYENFVFCLANKSQSSKLAREMVDINTFCVKKKPVSHYGVPSERLFVMSELSDVASMMFDQKMNNFIKNYEKYIQYIHITDQYSTIRSDEAPAAQKLANPKRMATFAFVFPQDQADVVEFLSFSLGLLDRLRRFKLAKDSKQKSDKNRQKISDIIARTALTLRQEALQAKKEELRRLEKEKIYSEDDPEKQKRWEKKEAKRELKKNKMRVKQLKVKSM